MGGCFCWGVSPDAFVVLRFIPRSFAPGKGLTNNYGGLYKYINIWARSPCLAPSETVYVILKSTIKGFSRENRPEYYSSDPLKKNKAMEGNPPPLCLFVRLVQTDLSLKHLIITHGTTSNRPKLLSLYQRHQCALSDDVRVSGFDGYRLMIRLQSGNSRRH